MNTSPTNQKDNQTIGSKETMAIQWQSLQKITLPSPSRQGFTSTPVLNCLSAPGILLLWRRQNGKIYDPDLHMLTVSPICGVFFVLFVFSKGEWRLHQTQSLQKLSRGPTRRSQMLEDEQPIRRLDQTSRYAYITDSHPCVQPSVYCMVWSMLMAVSHNVLYHCCFFCFGSLKKTR